MNIRIIVGMCLLAYTTKALPLSDAAERVLISLGLSLNDSFDYNAFILNIETVIEAAQEAAFDTIEQYVAIAEEAARIITAIGVRQNIKQINGLQSNYFQRIEAARHLAFNQNIDISMCAYAAVHLLNKESQLSISNVTSKLTDITKTFNDYSQEKYVEPANENMDKTYSIRERIYTCPFSFTDYSPFYTCLTSNAVLADIVILNEFTTSLNDTIKQIEDLVNEFIEAAELYQTGNIEAFNKSASAIYDTALRPCAQELGLAI